MTAEARKTGGLAVAVIAVALVDAVAHLPGRADPALPAIAAVDPADVTHIRLQLGDTITEIARADGSWRVTAPYDGPADAALVDAVLAPLARGVPMDARVDDLTDDNDDSYGLDNAHLLRVDVDGASGTLAAWYLGGDGPGGASFVRQLGDNAVYRARIGGRYRYERAPGEWRDRRIAPFDPRDVDAISVTGTAGSFALHRTGDGWRADDAGFAVDPRTVDDELAALAGARAIAFDAPPGTATATVDLALATGAHVILAVARDDGGATIDLDGARVRVSPALADALERPLAAYADRRLLAVDPTAVVSVVLDADGARSRFERGADGVWTRAEPRNVGFDAAAIEAAVARVAGWRAERWLDVPVADDAPRIVLATAHGGEELRIGARLGEPPDARTVTVGGRTAVVRGVDADVAPLR